MGTFRIYTYGEVKKLLDMLHEGKSDAEMAKELDRTSVALKLILKQWSLYQRGKRVSTLTNTMRAKFDQYIAERESSVEPVKTNGINHDTEVVTEVLATEPIVKDDMNTQVDELDSAIQNVQSSVIRFIERQTEVSRKELNEKFAADLKELADLRIYKVSAEEELTELRAFREAAQSSNFASMLKKKFVPNSQG